MNICKAWIGIPGILFALSGLLVVAIGGCTDDGSNKTRASGTTSKTTPEKTLSLAQAEQQLEHLVSQVQWSESLVNRRAKVELNQEADIADTLPDISEYTMVVDPAISPGDVAVEIFVTTVRTKKGADGRMVEVANAFNAADQRLATGERARVKIRKIASGTGHQYISSRKYLPDAYSPVHRLWIDMVAAKGIPMQKIRESMVKSVGGIVMKTAVADQIRSSHGSLDVKSIIHEVVQGNIAMGYTNPFHSSTGLNFLVTVLSTFADGQEDAMLSDEVVSTFEAFQRGVPFIALTTVHMRDSVTKGGSLDAFLMGHQTFLAAHDLQAGYEYLPFGVPHDHPLYAVGDIGAKKLEVLELLASFAERPEFQKLAKEYGWNQPIAMKHQSSWPIPSRKTLMRAQRLWKEKKDAGRPISAIFLCDVSGSMSGSHLSGVKKALISGSKFISPGNLIGLVFFSDEVRVVLPIKEFNLLQRASFVAAVEDVQAGGGTAMYNGIVKSMQLLLEEKRKNPQARLMLFVLTDGETLSGITYGEISAVVKGLRIPVYTIGYEANVDELKRLSGLVEAVSMNASEGQIEYKIGSLLNAQM